MFYCLKLLFANTIMSETEYVPPMYTIGQAVSHTNTWISKALLEINSHTQQLLAIHLPQKADTLYPDTLISEGTYGTVCKYISPTTGRACAVKAAKEKCIYACENPTDTYITMHQMGHPNFKQPARRTKRGPIVLTSFYGTDFGYQVMELAEQNGVYAYLEGVKYADMEAFVIASVQHLFSEGMCYTDYKLGNITFHRDHLNRMVLRLADVDSLGCNSVKEQFEVLQNRVATYPVLGNQILLGHPICDLLQTWYSAMITLFAFQSLDIDSKQASRCVKKCVHTHYSRSITRVNYVSQVFHASHPLLRMLNNEDVQDLFAMPRVCMAIRNVIDACQHSKIRLRSTERVDISHMYNILSTSLELIK
jgi:hypothetical protein